MTWAYWDTCVTGTVVDTHMLLLPQPGLPQAWTVVTIIVFTWVCVSTPRTRMMSTPSAPDARSASLNGSAASRAASGTTDQPGAASTPSARSLCEKTSSARRRLAGLTPAATTATRCIGPPVKVGSYQADWRVVVWHPARTSVERSREESVVSFRIVEGSYRGRRRVSTRRRTQSPVVDGDA